MDVFGALFQLVALLVDLPHQIYLAVKTLRSPRRRTSNDEGNSKH